MVSDGVIGLLFKWLRCTDSDIHIFIQVCVFVSGLSSVEEVATGVAHILADMIAKDPETLTYVKTL